MARPNISFRQGIDLDLNGFSVNADYNWKGSSDPQGSINYREGTLVYHNNSLWLALRDNDNVEPSPSTTSDWQIIATGGGGGNVGIRVTGGTLDDNNLVINQSDGTMITIPNTSSDDVGDDVSFSTSVQTGLQEAQSVTVTKPDGTVQSFNLVQPTPGLQSVTSDSTLNGDGTTSSPLSVANPFTQSEEEKLRRLNVREVSQSGNVTTVTRDDGTSITITEGGGGGGGPSTVSTDNTINGDGSSSSPLSVAIPFTQAEKTKLDQSNVSGRTVTIGTDSITVPSSTGMGTDALIPDWASAEPYEVTQVVAFDNELYRANQNIAVDSFVVTPGASETGTITVPTAAMTDNLSTTAVPEQFSLDFSGSVNSAASGTTSGRIFDGAGSVAVFEVSVPNTFRSSGVTTIFTSFDFVLNNNLGTGISYDLDPNSRSLLSFDTLQEYVADVNASGNIILNKGSAQADPTGPDTLTLFEASIVTDPNNASNSLITFRFSSNGSYTGAGATTNEITGLRGIDFFNGNGRRWSSPAANTLPSFTLSGGTTVRIQVPEDSIDENILLGTATGAANVAQAFLTAFNNLRMNNTTFGNYFTAATRSGNVVDFDTVANGDISAMFTAFDGDGDISLVATAIDGSTFVAPTIRIISGTDIDETLVLSGSLNATQIAEAIEMELSTNVLFTNVNRSGLVIGYTIREMSFRNPATSLMVTENSSNLNTAAITLSVTPGVDIVLGPNQNPTVDTARWDNLVLPIITRDNIITALTPDGLPIANVEDLQTELDGRMIRDITKVGNTTTVTKTNNTSLTITETPGALTTVSTDNTIDGSGTSSDPLSVANPFTTADENKLDSLLVRDATKSGDVTTVTKTDGSTFTITEGTGGTTVEGNPTTPVNSGNLTRVTIGSDTYNIPTGGSGPGTDTRPILEQIRSAIFEGDNDRVLVTNSTNDVIGFDYTVRGTTVTARITESGGNTIFTYSGGIVSQLSPNTDLVHTFRFTNNNFTNDTWELITTLIERLILSFDRGRLIEVEDTYVPPQYSFDRGRITLGTTQTEYTFDRGRLTGMGV